jgi:hypothetical protein
MIHARSSARFATTTIKFGNSEFNPSTFNTLTVDTLFESYTINIIIDL